MRDGWRRMALGDILKLRSERTHRVATLLSVTADRGVVRQSESGRRDSSSVDKTLYLDVHSGDLVYNTMRMWQGVSGVAPEAGIVSPAYTVCHPKGEIYTPFMGMLLKDSRLVSQFYRSSQGLVSDTWNLRYHEFKNIGIMLPSFKEQRRIADIINEVDAQIDYAKRQREKLMAATSANAAHVLHGVSVAHGIEWTTLDKVAEISAGVTLGSEEPEVNAVSLPYLRVANVQDGFIDTTDIKYVAVRNTEVERYRLQAGDVLLTEGGDLDKLGRGGVWNGTIDPCLHQNHIFKVRCDSTKVLPQFLAEYLASPGGKKYFLGIAKQTTNLASINSTQVKRAPIPLVPLDEQRRVLDSLEEWAQRISVANREIQKISALREGLSNRLLNVAASACMS